MFSRWRASRTSSHVSEMFGGSRSAAQSSRTRSPSYGRPIARGQAWAKWFSTTPTRSALRHSVGPRELAVVRPLALPSCVPSLHGHYPLLGYYGRSDSRPALWSSPAVVSLITVTRTSNHSVSNHLRFSTGACQSLRWPPIVSGFVFRSQTRPPPTESSSRRRLYSDLCYGLVVLFRCSPPRIAATQLRFDTGLHPHRKGLPPCCSPRPLRRTSAGRSRPAATPPGKTPWRLSRRREVIASLRLTEPRFAKGEWTLNTRPNPYKKSRAAKTGGSCLKPEIA